MSAAVLEVRRLTKEFGAKRAVDDLTFEVDAGTVTGFLGPNGAGKTTTLRMLLGLAQPTAGHATVLGRPYAEIPDPIRTVGVVLETTGFHPGRTGVDHLRVLCVEGGLPATRADEVLELTGMAFAAKQRVKGYSLGMRQRLGLAAALLGDPRILILDEPANGLDPEGIRWLRSLLRHLASEGRTVLVSSHVLTEVAELADHAVIIAAGRLVTQSSIADLIARGGNATVIVRSPSADALRAGAEQHGWSVSQLADGSLVVKGATAAEVGELAARKRLVLHELRTDTAKLEDVFLELTVGAGVGS
jgi:ABC-2 type transport system ATP-binding protein